MSQVQGPDGSAPPATPSVSASASGQGPGQTGRRGWKRRSPVDPVAFWRPRAAEPGTMSVMWFNPDYNACAHRDQFTTIAKYLPQGRGRALDLGCGTGRLTEFLCEHFSEYVGVDLDTMVEEAKRRQPSLRATFAASTVQDYVVPVGAFDLILSMACLASACRADELPDQLARCYAGLRPGGRLIMIDPFHRFGPLIRTCELAPREVVELGRSLGFSLIHWGGIHFIPVRLVFARRRLMGWPRLTRFAYACGETALRLARRSWSDYGVYVFEKN